MVAERSNTPPFRGGIEGDIFRIIIPLWCGDSNFPQVEEELERGETAAAFVIPWEHYKTETVKDGFKKWLNFSHSLEKIRKIKENRMPEEKKYGLKAARCAPQFSNR